MLDHYAQTDMDELIAAQEMILDALQPPRKHCELDRIEERIKTGIEGMGPRLPTVEKENGRHVGTRTPDLYRVKVAL